MLLVIEYVGEIVGQSVSNKRETEYISGKKLRYKNVCYFFTIDKEHIIDATRKGGLLDLLTTHAWYVTWKLQSTFVYCSLFLVFVNFNVYSLMSYAYSYCLLVYKTSDLLRTSLG